MVGGKTLISDRSVRMGSNSVFFIPFFKESDSGPPESGQCGFRAGDIAGIFPHFAGGLLRLFRKHTPMILPGRRIAEHATSRSALAADRN